MRFVRSILATLSAVALAWIVTACEPDETRFEETPPAEEVEIYEEPAPAQEPMPAAPYEQVPADTQRPATPQPGTQQTPTDQPLR